MNMMRNEDTNETLEQIRTSRYSAAFRSPSYCVNSGAAVISRNRHIPDYLAHRTAQISISDSSHASRVGTKSMIQY